MRELFDSRTFLKPASNEELAAVPNVTAITGSKRTRLALGYIAKAA
jgi:hypothetical protein